MAKSWNQYLEAHEGDAEAAGKAAVADIAKRENQNTAARAFKRAYTPLVESLKLPADVDTDSEGEAQTLAARALEGVSKPGKDEDAEATIDALTALIETYAEKTGIDLSAVLDGLPDNADDEAVNARIDEAFKPLSSLQSDAYNGKLAQAATALGKPADALAEILEGKTLEKRTVKAADGTESEQWGIPTGDTFKPLSDLKSIQLLGTAQPDRPQPAPLPTGQRGGAHQPVSAVQARIQAQQEQAKAGPADPFKPQTNTGGQS